MNLLLSCDEFLERNLVFEKVLKTVETSKTQEHLEACRNYFNEFSRAYLSTIRMNTEFECNFEKKRIEILTKDLQYERNGKRNKNMALQRQYPRLYKP